MSIHEAPLGPTDDGDDAERARGDRPRQAGRVGGAPGRGEVPVRIKCATLSWNALAQGLDEVAAEAC